jgi:hypothetical protein
MNHQTTVINIKALTQLLSDAHSDITEKAVRLTGLIGQLQEHPHRSKMYAPLVKNRSAELQAMLCAHSTRCLSLACEIDAITKALPE